MKSDNVEHTHGRELLWSALMRRPGIESLGPPIRRKPGCEHSRSMDIDSLPYLRCHVCGRCMAIMEATHDIWGDEKTPNKPTRFTEIDAALHGCKAYLVTHKKRNDGGAYEYLNVFSLPERKFIGCYEPAEFVAWTEQEIIRKHRCRGEQ